MDRKRVDKSSKRSAILEHAVLMATPLIAPKLLNPLALASRMGISLETLSRATGTQPNNLSANPRDPERVKELEIIEELWTNLIALFGDQTHAQAFLREHNPELNDLRPIDYFERGQPQVVLNLVYAMRELLP